jgi:hypothetical protein
MKDGTQTNHKDKSYQITSDAQEEADLEKIFSRITGQTTIQMTIAELLGITPKLELCVYEFIRRKQIPYTSNLTGASIEEIFTDESIYHTHKNDTVYVTRTDSTDFMPHYTATRREPTNESEREQLRVFFTNYASALPPANFQFYTITTGKSHYLHQ